MNIKQDLWKTVAISLSGLTLSVSLFGFANKVDAQVTRNQLVSSFLTSGSGRWLEIESSPFGSCYIYDLKPFVAGNLRVIREQYPKTLSFLTFGLETSPCRFSSFPLGGSRQMTGVIGNNGNTLIIRSATGFTEQIQFVRFDSQRQILIGRSNAFNFWQRL
jgi:hypothetical protein